MRSLSLDNEVMTGESSPLFMWEPLSSGFTDTLKREDFLSFLNQKVTVICTVEKCACAHTVLCTVLTGLLQHCVRFRPATKLNREEGAVQVSSLIDAVRSQSENIFWLFVFQEVEDEDDFDSVLGKFEEYFVPCRNVIHEHVSINVYKERVKKRKHSSGLRMNSPNIVLPA